MFVALFSRDPTWSQVRDIHIYLLFALAFIITVCKVSNVESVHVYKKAEFKINFAAH